MANWLRIGNRGINLNNVTHWERMENMNGRIETRIFAVGQEKPIVSLSGPYSEPLLLALQNLPAIQVHLTEGGESEAQ